MNHLKKVFFFVLIATITNCTSVSQEDLVVPITVETTTYITHVKPIIIANCVSCHNSSVGAFGPFPLETYDEVRDKVENGALLTRIQLPDGDPAIMPQTGKMAQNKIDVILSWVEDGLLEE